MLVLSYNWYRYNEVKYGKNGLGAQKIGRTQLVTPYALRSFSYFILCSNNTGNYLKGTRFNGVQYKREGLGGKFFLNADPYT